MTHQATDIEVEVVEIDGVAPVERQARAEQESPRRQGDWQDWRQWQGRVRQLDSRWWPLWAFLGIIAFILLITVGLVVGVILIIFKVLQGFVRAIQR
jgi:hypothetical protein